MVAVEDFMMRLDDPHSLMVLLLLLPIHFVGTYLSGLRARLMSYRIWHNFNIISAHASLQACAAILKLFCCSLFSWNAKVLRRNFWELLPLLPYHHHNYLSMANPNTLWGTEVVAIRVFVKRGKYESKSSLKDAVRSSKRMEEWFFTSIELRIILRLASFCKSVASRILTYRDGSLCHVAVVAVVYKTTNR